MLVEEDMQLLKYSGLLTARLAGLLTSWLCYSNVLLEPSSQHYHHDMVIVELQECFGKSLIPLSLALTNHSVTYFGLTSWSMKLV